MTCIRLETTLQLYISWMTIKTTQSFITQRWLERKGTIDCRWRLYAVLYKASDKGLLYVLWCRFTDHWKERWQCSMVGQADGSKRRVSPMMVSEWSLFLFYLYFLVPIALHKPVRFHHGYRVSDGSIVVTASRELSQQMSGFMVHLIGPGSTHRFQELLHLRQGGFWIFKVAKGDSDSCQVIHLVSSCCGAVGFILSGSGLDVDVEFVFMVHIQSRKLDKVGVTGYLLFKIKRV